MGESFVENAERNAVNEHFGVAMMRLLKASCSERQTGHEMVS
jgi:hypothetical protein